MALRRFTIAPKLCIARVNHRPGFSAGRNTGDSEISYRFARVCVFVDELIHARLKYLPSLEFWQQVTSFYQVHVNDKIKSSLSLSHLTYLYRRTERHTAIDCCIR